MATGDERIHETVKHLLRLTQEGKLVWRSEVRPAPQKVPPEYIEMSFQTKDKGRNLRLVKKRYWFDPRAPQPLNTVRLTSLFDSPKWTDDVYLEIADESWNSLWRFPTVPILQDLLSAVQYNVSGVKSYIDEIMLDKEKDSSTSDKPTDDK